MKLFMKSMTSSLILLHYFQFQNRSDYVKLMVCVMSSKTRSVMSCVYKHYPKDYHYHYNMDQCIANQKKMPLLLYKCAKEMEELNDPPIKKIPGIKYTVLDNFILKSPL